MKTGKGIASLTENAPRKPLHRGIWVLCGGLVCAAILLFCIWKFTYTPKSVTVPAPEVSLRYDENACYLGSFFTYQDRLYVHMRTESIADNGNILDAHLGTVTGMIPDWSPADGYADFAGNFAGEIYTVQGFDPAVVLCWKTNDGIIHFFTTDTGITVSKGRDWFEDRMQLSQRYASFQFTNWQHSSEQAYTLTGQDEILTAWIKMLDTAPFVAAGTPPEELQDSSGTILYQASFILDNGMPLSMYLFENGYISCGNMMQPLYLKLPKKQFHAFLALLEQETGNHPVVPAVLSLEDCRKDPELGCYLPMDIPTDATLYCAYICYYLDPETGKETGTKEIQIEFRSTTDSTVAYALTVTWADEYGKNGWAGPMMEADALSEEALAAYVTTETRSGRPVYGGTKISIGVWHRDVSVALHGSGIDETTAYTLFFSIPAFHG